MTTGFRSQPPPAVKPRQYPILLNVAFALSLLTACGQVSTIRDTSAKTPVDTKAAIQAWSTSGGQDRVSALAKDLSSVAATAAISDIAGLRAACTSLQTHVEAARAYAGIPDVAAQTHWWTALTHAALAAADCVAFTLNLDPDLLTRSGQELKAYDTEIGKLRDQVNTLDLLQG